MSGLYAQGIDPPVRDFGNAIVQDIRPKTRKGRVLVAVLFAIYLLSFTWRIVQIALGRDDVLSLMGYLFWPGIALIFTRPARVDARGMRAPGMARRIPWDDIVALDEPGRFEDGVMVIKTDGTRIYSGFRIRWMSRMTQIANDAGWSSRIQTSYDID